MPGYHSKEEYMYMSQYCDKNFIAHYPCIVDCIKRIAYDNGCVNAQCTEEAIVNTTIFKIKCEYLNQDAGGIPRDQHGELGQVEAWLNRHSHTEREVLCTGDECNQHAILECDPENANLVDWLLTAIFEFL